MAMKKKGYRNGGKTGNKKKMMDGGRAKMKPKGMRVGGRAKPKGMNVGGRTKVKMKKGGRAKK